MRREGVGSQHKFFKVGVGGEGHNKVIIEANYNFIGFY